MAAATFDTYAATQALRDVGFSEPQAAAAVAVIRDAVTEGVATKAAIGRLEAMIGALEARMTTRLYGVFVALVAVMFGLLKLL